MTAGPSGTAAGPSGTAAGPSGTAAAPSVDLPAGRWTFQAGNSEIAFKVKHLMISRVRGAFREFDGEIVVAENITESRATAHIAAASVDTGMPARDKDLRGPEFLNADEHPTLEFVSTGLTITGGDWKLTGDLTIAGQQRPVVLDVEYGGTASDPWGHVKAVFTARTSINREEFGLTYNKAIEGGGVLIGSTAEVEIEIQAQQVSDDASSS